MGERVSEPLGDSPIPPTAPASGLVDCAACRHPVDPLRAARVACFDDRFLYFCSAACREGFRPSKPNYATPSTPGRYATPRPTVTARSPVPTVALDPRHAQARALRAIGEESFEHSAAGGTVEPAVEWEARSSGPLLPSTNQETTTDLFHILLILGIIGSLLSIALSLAGSSGLALTARLLSVATAAVALISARVTTPTGPESPHGVFVLLGPSASITLSAVARLLGDPLAGPLLTLSGVIVAATSVEVWYSATYRAPLEAERSLIEQALGADAHQVVGTDLATVPAKELRPGEEIVVSDNEVVPADGTIGAGEAEVVPWLGSSEVVNRTMGDPIVAGARVKKGRLRVIVSASGMDRSWARLVLDPRRRADVHSQLARMGRLVSERGSIVAAGTAMLAAFASNLPLLEILAVAVAAQAAFFSLGQAEIGALSVMRAALLGLRRGITFRGPETLEQAARVTTAVFCARGTVLLGEPEVASIDPFGNHPVGRVLELVAGAESSSSQPVATAVLRAARLRGLRPDAVRSPTLQPGLGICAVASDGQQLVVGSRALMLREHVGVGVAEDKISELEAMGQTVLLVALGGRLVGILGLQDGLRPGARAAVQHLLDVDVEPVLMSGDTREASEAIGRALDIDHVRTDILPSERGDEVRRLAEGSLVVAVVGRSPIDDGAMLAADVSVALATAGCGSSDWHVQLASDDVRDAAFAIRLAHRCRSEARICMVLTLCTAGLGAVGVSLSLIPLWAGPLIGLVGSLIVALRFTSARD